jgi:hypothetical protein
LLSQHAVQALGDEREQLGYCLQVPLRVRRVAMTEIGGEQRQLAIDLGVGLVPVKQRADSERMSEVVRAWRGAVAASLKADLANQPRECVVDLGGGEPLAAC